MLPGFMIVQDLADFILVEVLAKLEK